MITLRINSFGPQIETKHHQDHAFNDDDQVMKDSQLFLVVAVLLAMDITIMTTWQLADPFYREVQSLKPYVAQTFSNN